MTECSISGCDKAAEARGWCHTHYMRWHLRGGDPAVKMKGGVRALPTLDRLRKHFEEGDPGECWLWSGALTWDGYGRTRVAGVGTGAHRAVYAELIGPIPEGMQLDHLCQVRNCVNPAHLEVVTPQENLRRRNAERTHCKHGHPLDEENTWEHEGVRRCRTCRTESVRRSRAKRAAT